MARDAPFLHLDPEQQVTFGGRKSAGLGMKSLMFSQISQLHCRVDVEDLSLVLLSDLGYFVEKPTCSHSNDPRHVYVENHFQSQKPSRPRSTCTCLCLVSRAYYGSSSIIVGRRYLVLLGTGLRLPATMSGQPPSPTANLPPQLPATRPCPPLSVTSTTQSLDGRNQGSHPSPYMYVSLTSKLAWRSLTISFPSSTGSTLQLALTAA